VLIERRLPDAVGFIQTIQKALQEPLAAQQRAALARRYANLCGGKDNITAVFVELLEVTLVR